MAAFYQKSYTAGISNNDWFRDHSSTETTPEAAGSAGSNLLLTPTSPLEAVALERDTGVTIGLGLVPYLANLWLEDPFDTRIVFRIKMGIDHFSKSVIEGSMDNAFEGNSSNPIPLSRTPNLSTLSPYLLPPDHDLSHFSQPEMQHPVCNDYEPFDRSYYDLMDGNNNENNNQCTVAAGSDVSIMDEHANEEFEDNVSSSSSEYIYGPIEGMDTHLISNNNNGAPLSAGAGDHHLSATFGAAWSTSHDSADQYQYPTERFMIKCPICRNYLYKEHNDIFIFKGEYAFCNTQCRQVAVGLDNFQEKAVNRALKESAAKRLENIGKFPVVFELGPSSN
ncbi:hypothetical protein QQ045_016895 [Rhodiola kirilowii]